MLRYAMALAGVAAIAAVLLMAEHADLGGGGETRLNGTLTNPDGRVTARYITVYTGGAAGAADQRVELVANGAHKTVLVFDSTTSPQIVWRDANALSISLGCGLVHAFSNYFEVPVAQSEPSRRVDITLLEAGLCQTDYHPTPPPDA